MGSPVDYEVIEMAAREEILKTVKETLDETDRVVLAIVYGSAASGAVRGESDVDVAILCNTAMAPEERLALSQRLGQRLGRDVDIVDLNAADGVLLKQILTKGKVVVKKQAAAYAGLLKKMIYGQEDYMHYYRRALRACLKSPVWHSLERRAWVYPKPNRLTSLNFDCG
jgi:predicted nucleotidyltransferase